MTVDTGSKLRELAPYLSSKWYILPETRDFLLRVADELDRLRERVSELEDTILLREAGDDIARSFGRNTEAGEIERDIMSRRGEDWRGAVVEWRKKP